MPRDPDQPRLTFTPRAWLKWLFLAHAGPTEVAAFGLAAEDDLLRVEDLIVLKQTASAATVAFDDTAVAELFDGMADAGVPPRRFARIWLHTHPGASVSPSSVDEETFLRVFGHCAWALMGILGKTGRVSARLRFGAGPGGALEIPCDVDWSLWPDYATSRDLADDTDLWLTEFAQLVEPIRPRAAALARADSFLESPEWSFDPFSARSLDER